MLAINDGNATASAGCTCGVDNCVACWRAETQTHVITAVMPKMPFVCILSTANTSPLQLSFGMAGALFLKLVCCIVTLIIIKIIIQQLIKRRNMSVKSLLCAKGFSCANFSSGVCAQILSFFF